LKAVIGHAFPAGHLFLSARPSLSAGRNLQFFNHHWHTDSNDFDPLTPQFRSLFLHCLYHRDFYSGLITKFGANPFKNSRVIAV